jgi:hypothetical protein
VVILAVSSYLSFGPVPVRVGNGTAICPAGLNALAIFSEPDPLPRSAAGYQASEACDRQDRRNAPLGLGLMLPAVVVLLAWARLQRNGMRARAPRTRMAGHPRRSTGADRHEAPY